MIERGGTLNGDKLSRESVLFIEEGNCIRYLFDSEGNHQAVTMVGPSDIIGLSTRLNDLHIPGETKIINKLVGTEISMNLLLEWTKKEPLFLYENLQYDIMLANSAIRMNGMSKKTKIYYILIELLRENHVNRGASLQLKSYISQGIIGEFSGTSKGYISRTLAELGAEGILNPHHVAIICDKPEALLDLSESHRGFTVEEIFS